MALNSRRRLTEHENLMDEYTYRLKLSIRLAAGILALAACWALLGWLLGNRALIGFNFGSAAMNPETAVLFLITSVCLALQSNSGKRPRIEMLKRGLGGVVLVASLLTLVGFFLGWPLHLDRVFFKEALDDNHMAPNTAACFILISGAIIITETSRGRRLSEALALIVLGAALIPLLGHGYGADNAYGIGNYISMALNTALLFAAAAIGILCIHGEEGVLNSSSAAA
jgi:hypothetical protein